MKKETHVKNITRRSFVYGAASAALSGCATLSGAKFSLAMAGFTLNSFKTDDALKFCEEHSFTHLCVKDRHLPMNASAREIGVFRRKCLDHGVTPYGAGPVYMCTKDEVKRAFDYTAALGATLLVGVPAVKNGPKWSDRVHDRVLCEYCSALADEYAIRFAIHNHGRNPKTGNPKMYPAVPEINGLIKDLSPRMGFCVDWAYTYADGLDCEEIVFRYADRIFDGHVRCISDAGNGSSGVNPAQRAFGYEGIFDALKSIGYSGCLGLELANAFPSNVGWIDESRDYFRSLM